MMYALKNSYTDQRRCVPPAQPLHLFFVIFIVGGARGEVRYYVPEELQPGSVIGNLMLDLDLDVAEMAKRNARVVAEGDRQFCNLNEETGFLLVSERMDREELCAQAAVCVLQFQLLVENPLQVYSLVLEIQDINDNTPFFVNGEIELEIAESTAVGRRFPLESAWDPDLGPNAVKSYRLSKSDYFALEMNYQVNGNASPELVLHRTLDHETLVEHHLTISGIDGGDPVRSGTAAVLVRVLDANDNVPVFSQRVYRASVVENSPRGTLVTALNATDSDRGQYGEVMYSFSHVSDETRGLVEIDSVTGVVRVTGLMDYEESSAHELDVRAKDGGGQSSHCKLIIDVIDVNDNVPIVSVKSASASVAEDSYSGAMVALLNVHDPDTGAGGRVSCYISDNVPFRLISEVKNYFMLVTDDVLDRETHSHFNITVTAADDGSPPLMSSEVISISVADVNDNAPIFTHSFYDAEVPENQPRNTPVVRVSAEDRDLGKNAKIKYSLSSHADFFSVDADTGNVFTVRPFDHETLNYFQIDVTATDGGDPSLTGHCTVRILVTDQNDNAPVILYPVQSNGSIAEEMVPLAAPEGYLVTKVVAVDADVGHNAWLSYRIVQTSQPNLFSVGIHCGEIRTLRPFTEDDVNKHAIVVSVKDNGAKSLSATATVRIAVGDTAAALDELSGLSTGVQMDSDFTLHLLISLAAVCVLFLFLTGALVCFGRRKPTFYRESVSNLPVFPPTYSRRGYSSQCATLHDDSRSDWFLTTGSWKGDFRFGSGVIDYDAIRGKSVAPPKNKIVVRD
ncbi:protocadherin gamma-A6-like [Denticeps clupeoides]|uniref:protocadherin gamma-A6-like n=1 Tax=Denticeps clupeoides TaxID=299321 RepID=UPI0010A4471D|nr:protocadherin gamma-A6-like [Denticeps clupeoides]